MDRATAAASEEPRFAQDRYAMKPTRPRSLPSSADSEELSAGAFRDMTVLVVEDDAATRESLEVILAHYGAHVLSASTMGDALALYERDRPALVISDIGLTQGDGYMLLRAIRCRERTRGGHVPAIAVSGFPSHESSDRAGQAGFDAFLHKPVEIRALLRLARHLASQYRHGVSHN